MTINGAAASECAINTAFGSRSIYKLAVASGTDVEVVATTSDSSTYTVTAVFSTVGDVAADLVNFSGGQGSDPNQTSIDNSTAPLSVLAGDLLYGNIGAVETGSGTFTGGTFTWPVGWSLSQEIHDPFFTGFGIDTIAYSLEVSGDDEEYVATISVAPQSGWTWNSLQLQIYQFQGSGLDSGALNPALFTDTDTFFSPSVVGPRVLTPSLFSDTDSFFTPTVVRGFVFGDLTGTLQANANSITNPFAATGSVAVSVGDLVVSLLVEQTNLTETGVTDNLGNSYTAQNAGTDAGAVTARLHYSIVTVAGTLTQVRAAATASSDDAVHIAAVFKGPFTAIDANVANITSDITTPFTCPSSGTLVQAAELVIGWGAANQSTTWTATSPNTLALQLANSTTIKGIIGYQTVAATTAVAPVFARSGGSNPTQAILGTLSFKKDLTQPLTAELFSDSDQFYAADVSQGNQSLTAALFSDTDAFFTHIVTPGAVTLTASLFTDTDTFGAATVNSVYALTASLVTDTDTFFQPTVAPGAVTLTPGLFTDTDAFFGPTVTVGAVNLTAALFTDTDAFFSPSVTLTQNLAPSLYSDNDQFFSATITVGAVTLTPSLFTDTDTFHAAVVSSGTSFVAPDPFVDTDTFYQPTIGRGAVGLTASLVVDTDQFYSATITRGGVTLTAGLFTDTDSFGAATLTNLNAVTAPLFSDTDTFFSPTVASVYPLTAPLVTDADQFFTPSITQDQIQPPLYVDTDVFYSPSVAPGNVTIFPQRFVDTDAFPDPLVFHGREGGGTSTSPHRRRDKRLKTGFEPVIRQKPEPKLEPVKPALPPWLPVPTVKPKAPRTPVAEIIDPRLVPTDLLSIEEQAMEALRRGLEQREIDFDEQDAADIADILALLD